MVERCARCNINGEEVRLFDAIYEGRMESLCERCSIIENIPIIKKPAASQLRNSEKSFGVYSRMKRLAGIKDHKKEETFFREDRLNELNEHPNLETPEKDNLNLINNFHWEIMKNRRRKGLSQKQLAENLGESEIVIQMIEKAKLPEKAEQLIRKIEQFLQVKLTKISDAQRFLQVKRKSPVLLDSEGRELFNIPEPEIKKEIKEKYSEEKLVDDFLEDIEIEMKKPEEVRISKSVKPMETKETFHKEEPEQKLIGINIEKGEFDIEKANLRDVKISDIKELHRKKIEVTKKEQIEEQKRIESRNRLIEARKEELRLMKEKESSKLDEILGGTELLVSQKSNNESEDFKEIEEIEDELR
jgi:ribosome-binding protein aMBF1 (putative translation factor)